MFYYYQDQGINEKEEWGKKIKGEKERNGLTIMRSEGSETEKMRGKKHLKNNLF